jgi:hypothetical protein
MIPMYSFHKPFTIILLDLSELEGWFHLERIYLVYGMIENKSTGARVCSWGPKKELSFSLRSNIYAIKACMNRNIYILLDMHVAIKSLGYFQIKSKLGLSAFPDHTGRT